jgi:putative heme-binding domain-containing protein
MPANKFSEAEAADIVAYLHSMNASAEPETVTGEVARGKTLFDGKGDCITCHTVRGTGGTVGPDLTGVGRIRKADDLTRSILEPNAEVLYSYRSFRGRTRGGDTVTGRVLNEDTFTVQVLDRDGRLRSFLKSDFLQYEFLNESAMPSYRAKLTPAELADLVAYLASL